MDNNVATYDDLKRVIRESGRTYDNETIERAYVLAESAHRGQLRRSGAPYISHPVSVAVILVHFGMDTDSIVAALLHDVVEDTSVEIGVIEKEFGKEIANLVEGVTKLGQVPYVSREEQQAENIRKMFLAMAVDIRVMIIKLADRLHNARTFEFLPEEKRRYKALETMEIYAPIADRLGIRTIKEELEDICLKYLDPIANTEIERHLKETWEQETFLEKIIKDMNARILPEHPKAHIEGRIKSHYGIYRKVYMNGRDFSDIYDIYAVRVIVDSVIECYNILGIIHDMFKPIPNRFKDYISTPKQNMYQSLHTSCFDKSGTPFEVQIRTWDMHYTAEYGIAAHWKYKMGMTGGKNNMEDRLAWVRQILESQQEGDDAEEIVRSIKTDIAPEEVFVFTPNGDVMSLPMGATVLDFAYKIHSAVGNHMVGAKIDGKISAIDTPVQTGMIVEIMTQANKTPNRDWLSIARTSEARTKIRSWFKKEKREENIEEGREILLREFKRNSINPTDEELAEILEAESRRQNLSSSDDFLASIGYGGFAVSKIIPRLKEEFQKKHKREEREDASPVVKFHKEKKASSGVIVEGIDNCLVKFSKCCNPLPGDEIVGFITRGYGVSIHKKDCPNAVMSMEREDQSARWVKAHWAGEVQESFQSTIEIIGQNRGGLLADVSMLFNNLRVDLHSFNAKELKDETLMFKITMAVNDTQQLNFVVSQVKKIKGVIKVDRVSG